MGIFLDKQDTIKIIEWPQLINIPLSEKLEIHLDYVKNENERARGQEKKRATKKVLLSLSLCNKISCRRLKSNWNQTL